MLSTFAGNVRNYARTEVDRKKIASIFFVENFFYPPPSQKFRKKNERSYPSCFRSQNNAIRKTKELHFAHNKPLA